MNILDELISSISKLPSIGRKSAKRIAYYLLEADSEFLNKISSEIRDLQKKIKKCNCCGAWTEEDICDICQDSSRNSSLLCVVENSSDIATIESTSEYNGFYHVLGGAIAPLDGVSPADLTIAELMQRCKNGNVKELIIATNPTVQGDTTALYILELLKESGIKVSRLASGLPVGGDLEYIDKVTLSRSFRGRIQF